MSYEQPLFMISLLADVDMSSYQFRFVEFNSSGKVEDVTDDGDLCIGVYQENSATADGDAMQIMVLGISKVEVGTGGVTVADKIQAEGDATAANAGRAMTAASSDWVQGIALATGIAGDIVPILLLPSIGTVLA